MTMSKKIIEFGQDCYWNGGVENYTAKEDNEYEAKVTIQENYSVKLKLDEQGQIILGQSTCSCADGPCCKHVLAVFCAVKGGANIECALAGC